jgi:hypothetical protein
MDGKSFAALNVSVQVRENDPPFPFFFSTNVVSHAKRSLAKSDRLGINDHVCKRLIEEQETSR